MSARAYDMNGWFEVRDNPISLEGIFDYSSAQIGGPEMDRMYRVYRPAAELSDPETLDSFKLVPLIDDHTMLGDGFAATDDVGVAGVIGQDVRFSDGVMTGNIKVFGKRLAEKIKSGKTELSCGYRCVYDFTPGTWNGQAYDAVQRQIRGNHVALVDEGRMGPSVAVLDQMVFTVDAKEQPPVDDEMKAALAAILTKLDALAATEKAEIEDEDPAPAEEPVKDEDPAPTEEPVKDEDPAPAEGMDALAAEIKALRADVAGLKARPVLDEAAVLKTLADKAALIDRLKPHVGVFDSAAMSYADVARYGVEKLGIKGVKGHEAVALDAWLQARPVATVAVQDGAATTTTGKGIAAWAAGKKE